MASRSSKIRYHDAGRIADAIAEKAFEHLTKPLEAEQQKLGWAAYQAMFKELGTSPQMLLRAGFAEGRTEQQLSILNSSGQEACITLVSENEFAAPSSWGNSEMRHQDDDMFERANDLAIRLAPYYTARGKLRDELKNQIEDKTVNTVLKNWPEASAIILQLLDIESKPDMTVPLEQLLARFLPALPAPKE